MCSACPNQRTVLSAPRSMSVFVKQSVENFLASPIFQHALLIPAYAPGTFFQSLTPHPTGEQQLGTVDNTLPPPCL